MSNTPSHTPTTVSLADEEAVRRILVDTLFGLGDVTTCPGSSVAARALSRDGVWLGADPAGDWVYEEVSGCARPSALGCDIITGGGPGLMQAANEGARAAQSRKVQSIGIRVDLPFEQDVNPFVDQAFEHQTFFTDCTTSCSCPMPTSSHLVESARCSNHDDLAALADAPPTRHALLFAGPMWRGLVEWAAATMLGPGAELANPEDMRIPRCVENAARSGCRYPGPPRTLVDCAGQELLTLGAPGGR